MLVAVEIMLGGVVLDICMVIVDKVVVLINWEVLVAVVNADDVDKVRDEVVRLEVRLFTGVDGVLVKVVDVELVTCDEIEELVV
jgi:hypothetical protein